PSQLYDQHLGKKYPDGFVLDDEDEGWIDFCLYDLPELRATGWRVDMDANFRFNFAKVEDWTVTVEEGGGNDWFGLGLGIQV
ncbi:hypothetical protein, partial [Ferrovum sp.]|uniref:hypothetical protein n=1 Tax=Ferrovum sp. TaxID=2609467 RepID=UPI00262DFD90